MIDANDRDDAVWLHASFRAITVRCSGDMDRTEFEFR